MYEDRIRNASLRNRVISADEAAALFQDGMTVGMSGFTRAGDAKEVPLALAERSKRLGRPIRINLWTGASVAEEVDRALTEAGCLARRLPYQSEKLLRDAINRGEVMYLDQHLSLTVEMIRDGQLGNLDIAVIEAVAITEDGGIIPSTSVGNSPTFVKMADKVIIELNYGQPAALEGMHDVYIPFDRPNREPIPILEVGDRIGTPYIPVDMDKVAGIVITNKLDHFSPVSPVDEETEAIAGHLLDFFEHEIRAGRMTDSLHPLQSGIGSVANAVLSGLKKSRFENLEMYSEVLQDSVFELIDAGKLRYASGCSITLSPARAKDVLDRIADYRDKIVLRPQEISNHPGLVRRLGIIAMNTAIEADIYGNVNSTHVMGTKMMNGIGGSGDFARNAYITIFVTKSTAKNGAISSIVPMASHVDHTEHDVDILVTEQGLADLRGLAPRERAQVIIRNCAHPYYRDALMDYYRDALKLGGHTPHVLDQALSWHSRFMKEGSMRIPVVEHR